MKRRTILGAFAAGVGFLAGCTGSSAPGSPGEPSPTGEPHRTPTGDDTPTPVVDGTPTTVTDESSEPITGSPGSTDGQTETPIDPYEAFPEGPKEPPDRPDSLTRKTVREFVKTFEYRYVYNSLWFGESTEVDASCEIERVDAIGSGYEVVVSCTAHSNTGGEPRENGTGTSTVVHADYFTQTFVYVVEEDSVSRRRYEREADPTTTQPPPATATPPPTPTRTPREVDR